LPPRVLDIGRGEVGISAQYARTRARRKWEMSSP
jgi:hypothetical protein